MPLKAGITILQCNCRNKCLLLLVCPLITIWISTVCCSTCQVIILTTHHASDGRRWEKVNPHSGYKNYLGFWQPTNNWQRWWGCLCAHIQPLTHCKNTHVFPCKGQKNKVTSKMKYYCPSQFENLTTKPQRNRALCAKVWLCLMTFKYNERRTVIKHHVKILDVLTSMPNLPFNFRKAGILVRISLRFWHKDKVNLLKITHN